ncbi:NAD-dependent epimerase/dehydratase family protein [Ectobacillus antri]|jgi:UDP-glucose 4-epimerase|uniref:NAD-dependent epimerase/dehydratase family protein n=1 Tax=Ectobacillus antri TaxID=2486280 RepID=UPI000F5A603B|nr:NAD-dependent epimerase/dehydratase family protein [Ectobacillus antri]
MIVVIGGAGYVGSHIVKTCIDRGHRVVVLDNLSTGHRVSVSNRAVFEKGDFGNAHDLDRVFSRYSVDVVIHVATSHPDETKQVRHIPQRMQVLLYKMKEYGIEDLVLSEASYMTGLPAVQQFYQQEQMMIRKLLAASKLRSITVRACHIAGATEYLGEDHEPEAHLIPRLLKHSLRPNEKLILHPGFEGAYAYVADVAKKHVLCAERLLEGKEPAHHEIYGHTATVSDIVAVCRSFGLRPDISYEKSALQTLPTARAWQSLEEIIYSALRWHMLHPNGYEQNLVYR